jgi:short-subunit dehydrogenase
VEEIRAAGGEAHGIAADVADKEAVHAVAGQAAALVGPVDLLINNAGFTVKQWFVGGDLAAEERMLDVLVRAVLILSSAAAPGMVRRGRGALVTVSSVASFLPSGTYSAAKAWATTFTMSLAAELAGTGVSATALCPGYVHTEFHGRAGIRMGRLPEVAWRDADEVVAACLRDVARGRSLSVPSLRYRGAVLAARHAPLRLLERVARGRMRRRYR